VKTEHQQNQESSYKIHYKLTNHSKNLAIIFNMCSIATTKNAQFE